MANARRPVVRFVLALAVSLLVFLDVQALLQTLHSQARVRDAAVKVARDTVSLARPRLQALLDPGEPIALAAAGQEALRLPMLREFEIFDARGGRMFSQPAPAPASHWPREQDRAALDAGQIVTGGPLAGSDSRLFVYAPMRVGTQAVIARFAFEVPDVLEDLRQRREILLGHALSLALLVVTSALLLLPRHEDEADAPRALDAYEQAMGRLRDRGLAQSREHEAERLRLEERLAASAPMARAGELTAGMAHEVRNGLGTILGYARLLEGPVTRPDQEAAARAIREECEALETVVRRFVDFVKDETLHIAPFDLRRTLSRVAARELRRVPGAAVVIEPGEPVSFEGDEEMLERAFENLVRNALEAAGASGHVAVRVGGDAQQAEVRVEDDGPGLSAEVRSSLRPFLTTKPGGLGLGLPMVFKIVGLHRGDILMGERVPHGLAVSVRLPRPGKTVTGSSALGPTVGSEETS